MIIITPQAARQIRLSAEQGGTAGLKLRIAARVTPDETIDYAIGFDELREGDIEVVSHEITIVIDGASQEFLNGVMLDYVELEPGTHHFIFHNPNDPNYKPPKEDPALDYYEQQQRKQ